MSRKWLMAVALLVAGSAQAGPMSVKWSFKNIVDGYDHENRMDVYVDGNKIAESTVTLESTPNSLKVTIPDGAQNIRIVNMAHYEGNWEEHTIANDYSQDCFWEWSSGAKKHPKKVSMLVDIDAGVTIKAK